MSSVRMFFASAAMVVAGMAFVGAAPALAGVVVKSSGPSAAKYPVGKKLDDDASITLEKGDSVTVLTDSGTRVLSGAGRHQVGARGASKRTAFAMLTRQQSGARVRTGAVRGGPGSAETSNPNLWNVDTSQGGRICLPKSDTITFWRPATEGQETWVLGATESNFHVHVTFDDGATTARLAAAQLPLAEDRRYEMTSGSGGTIQRIEIVTLENTPDDPEGLAVLLAENGCDAQLELLSEKLAG